MKVYAGKDVEKRRHRRPRRLRQDDFGGGDALHGRRDQPPDKCQEGNTVTDYDDEEISRKISIATALAIAEWRDAKVNLIDTPGYNIFINDAQAALIAADTAWSWWMPSRHRSPDREVLAVRRRLRSPQGPFCP